MTHTTMLTLPREAAEPFSDLEAADLGPLLDRIGDARLVLLGEATHGTSEFYRMRARISRELILKRGFNIIAAEADWPDAARIDDYIRHLDVAPANWIAFARFPTWMWRNEEVRELVEWLREHNVGVEDKARQVSFHGLDLYSLFTSINEVLTFLDRVDPEAAKIARRRYACLSPWGGDPAAYGHGAVTQRHADCEEEVTAMLVDLMKRRIEYSRAGREEFLDALMNARLILNAERYYRIMYYGSRESWNLRDTHMFETLQMLLELRPGSRALVWAHNSHLGDAAATDMGDQGEINVGHLCRDAYGDGAYLVGFGTDHGTVLAATEWDEPGDEMLVRSAHPDSYERFCHEWAPPSCLIPLRQPHTPELRELLTPRRLERAIGVVYRPETERLSHYFHASLPAQFDEWIWFDETRAVTPLGTIQMEGLAETYPFGV